MLNVKWWQHEAIHLDKWMCLNTHGSRGELFPPGPIFPIVMVVPGLADHRDRKRILCKTSLLPREKADANKIITKKPFVGTVVEYVQKSRDIQRSASCDLHNLQEERQRSVHCIATMLSNFAG